MTNVVTRILRNWKTTLFGLFLFGIIAYLYRYSDISHLILLISFIVSLILLYSKDTLITDIVKIVVEALTFFKKP